MAVAHPANPAATSRIPSGRCDEDFAVNDVSERWSGRAIAETDDTGLTLLTMNTHPLHFDAAYAVRSEFGRCSSTAASPFPWVVGMTVNDVNQKAIGNLAWSNMKLIEPAFVADNIVCRKQGRLET